MPRKRMIDPEFWKDEKIAECSFEARLFFIALWNFADDEGKLEAGSKRLKHEIFPYDEKVTEKVIDRLKKEVEGMVVWYRIEDKLYGLVKNFKKRQIINHPGKSDIPNPKEDSIITFKEQGAESEEPAPEKKEKSKSSTIILQYLNEKSQRCFKETKTNLALIENVMKDGYSEDDCRLVIDNRVYEWITKPKGRGEELKMAEYVRPSTIFRLSKFSQYFGIAKGIQEQNEIRKQIEKKKQIIQERPDAKPTKEEEEELKILTEKMKSSKFAQSYKLSKTLEALNEEADK